MQKGVIMLSQKRRALLQRFFEQQKAIIAGYLFGSFAKGRNSRFSDIDVAILVAEDIAPSAYADLQSQYMVDLSEHLGCEMDILILNHAPPFVKFQVFRYGQRLFERDRTRSRRFVAASIVEYFDFEPLKRIMEQRVIEHLKERSL